MFNCDISVKFIFTIDQVADIFTKALSSARFAHLTSKLMVIPPPISLQGAVRITDMHSDMAKDNAKPLSEDHIAAQNSSKDHDAAQNSNVPIVIT